MNSPNVSSDPNDDGHFAPSAVDLEVWRAAGLKTASPIDLETVLACVFIALGVLAVLLA